MTVTTPPILTVEEAAEVARCSVKTVRRAYTSGALTAYRRRGSRTVLLDRQDVLAWVHGQVLRSSAAVTPSPTTGRHRRPAVVRANQHQRAQQLGSQVRFDLSPGGLLERRSAARQSQERHS
jgi:excisionase family DNA binding protein